VLYYEATGMQGNAPGKRPSAAILFVANDGITACRELNAYLVFSSGQKVDIDQRCELFAV
jgi:hypothetical protein